MISKSFAFGVLAISIGLGHDAAWAAKAPVSPEKLQRDADLIVTGTVMAVITKTQRSEIETGAGFHRDRIYRIKLQVKAVAKGDEVSAGDEIEFVAWRPVRRIPPLPGLQGHDAIPKKGDAVKVYLKRRQDGTWEPILPNGITISE